MVSIIIDVVLICYLIITGVMQVAQGKASGIKEGEYTPESIRKYSRISGVIQIFTALPLLLSGLISVTRSDSEFNLSEYFPFIASLPEYVRFICWGVVALFIVLIIVVYAVTLKKVDKKD